MTHHTLFFFFFFFNDTATTEIYTLSLHDALPIYVDRPFWLADLDSLGIFWIQFNAVRDAESESLATFSRRSEEHTSELQSLTNLVCRLLLEKKNKNTHRVSCRT